MYQVISRGSVLAVKTKKQNNTKSSNKHLQRCFFTEKSFGNLVFANSWSTNNLQQTPPHHILTLYRLRC